MNVVDTLTERGFIHEVSNADGLRRQLERPSTLYCGFDPTRDSLQVGNLVQVMLLAHMQRSGHRPIVLLGGGTTMIGDPSGKTAMRELLTQQQIEDNARSVRRQFSRYVEFSDDRALLLNNAEWLLKLGYIEFLRDIGRHFSVNQLLQHETYRQRMRGDGLNFIELNYPLAQAFDYLHLFRTYGCVLQIGGSDQWFNILSGVDLVRREAGAEVFALVTPLIATASGTKMGKTEAGAVWLDSSRTSAYDYYQFWRNTEDPDVERFLKLFTFLPLDEILALGALRGEEVNRAKELLAFEATRLTHGEVAAHQAQESARALFGGSTARTENLPGIAVLASALESGVGIVEALVLTGQAPSRSGAKALVQGGGVYLNGQRVERSDRRITEKDLVDDQILIRRGKVVRRLFVSG